MRKIVSGLFLSLDGVYEAPGEWHLPYFNEDMGRVVSGLMDAADTMLLGRVTYQEFAGYWPTSDDDIADYMNSTPKVVVSTSLEKGEWGDTTVVRGDVAQQLTELKRQRGKNISITGSGSLVRSLLRARVLDELHLLVHPIVVGSGKRLFEPDGGGRQELELIGSETFDTGVVYLSYRLV